MELQKLIHECGQVLEMLQAQHKTFTGKSGSLPEQELSKFNQNIRTLFQASLQLQQANALKLLEEMSQIPSEQFASAPVKTSDLHLNSVVPGPVEHISAQPEIPVNVEKKQEPVTMDRLMVEAAMNAASAASPVMQTKPKKHVSDLHEKFEDLPTLAGKFSEKETHGKRIASASSSQNIADRHSHKPIIDLKSSIGINEKFLFINQLFAGDAVSYNQAIEKLNNSSSAEEARKYIESEIAGRYEWETASGPAHKFLEFVERRYSA
ncbi:MAG: hypothetical protein DWQ44_02005 [Bacteroidetes bacterium]|nr:MAG: hypothetical protein DWQ33_05735 [Bacteroidota bacterium]REK04751.1 MAG: hypothetical protein DWQ39_05900 [Bacteroidota bacterium]REK36225.1 MAG: hypothetical protein DWQ44_02005 [Bacteroidota bacterium]REK51113.1 MAG: hypothetical protein DWQ48_03220 [Bacteroidota bacterium]